jgi:hypothetical protein
MHMPTTARALAMPNTSIHRVAIGLGLLSLMTAIQLLVAYGPRMLY